MPTYRTQVFSTTPLHHSQPNFRQNFQPQQQHFNSPSHHTPPQRPSFPSQPINIQPRQVKQHFPTNAQVFGKPQPVFGKNTFVAKQNAATNNPTPMSISRQISHRPNRYNFANYTPQRKYTVEELFNTETNDVQYDSDSYCDYNPIENFDPIESCNEDPHPDTCENFPLEASENMN